MQKNLLAYADEPELYKPRVGDRVALEAVVWAVVATDGSDFVKVRLAGEYIDVPSTQLRLISRKTRTITIAEAERLLREKLGEDIEIE